MDVRRLALMAMVGLAGGCGSSGGGGNQPDGGNAVCTITGVSLTGSPASVTIGGAPSNLTATVHQASGSSGCNGGVIWGVSPGDNLLLTPSGLTATFNATAPGTYTLTATSRDDTSKVGSFQVTVSAPSVCGTPNGTVVTHSTPITADETWAGNGVTHSVPSSIRIKAPATVTIQPCAIVSIAKDAEIGVEGDTAGNRPAKLIAAGTDDATGFITFQPAVT
ncbi:MAG TPA: hypothetical protein VGF31_11055, partial [Myxococcaceae bacterium]